MKIEKNKMVSLTYELRENDKDGNVIETIDSSRPLKFLYGAGKLIPSFENNISALDPGDPFSFSIEAANAYGEKREEMIINVPLSVFLVDGKLDENICKTGNQVPMMDSEGNHLNGTILEIGEETVRMDFNHPMAGTNLYFSGKILNVSEPTAEDLNPQGHSCSGCNPNDHSDCSGGCSC